MNLDQAHSEWLERYKRIACHWLGGRNGVEGSVINSSDELLSDPVIGEEFDYVYDGDLSLPPKSADICKMMALSSTATPMDPPRIKGLYLENFPLHVFNLRSLLLAAYPRDVKTDFFKGDNVGINILADEDSMTEAQWSFASFGGLGIILMEECRMLINEALTDEEVVDACAERYLLLGE